MRTEVYNVETLNGVIERRNMVNSRCSLYPPRFFRIRCCLSKFIANSSSNANVQ
ncbi:AVB_G0036480.mRNA.1.CDS.1 [Saccharomyces cerevisiae]|nr:AVB_G0036480.mRNA.1.CDS.1 [Saccharomyces cerevisiae]CAI7267212.1 AVB_G0036480.mRNA.1.CDS.1 [Saccharomyces cerevisiae]